MMDLPDITTCQDAYRAYRAYRQWDGEAARDIEIERLREAYTKAATAEDGRGIFQDLAEGLAFDDDRLHRMGNDLAWTALMAFYGQQDNRTEYKNQILAVAERMAARMYQIISQEAEKAAEKTLTDMEDREMWR